MNGPFPGVDPWLEVVWSDFHTTYVGCLRDVIKPLLPAGFRVRIEAEVLPHPVSEAWPSRPRPDGHLFVGESAAAYEKGSGGGTGGVGVAAPTKLIRHAPFRQKSLRILDAATGGRVVAVIEMLSPTNKRRGTGLDAYLRKQAAMEQAGVHLLEIDLPRGGADATLAARAGLRDESPCPHHVSLHDARDEGGTALYAVPFGQALPAVPLPLTEAEHPVPVDLQAALREAIGRGDYQPDLRYDEDPPGPPLTPDERAWVDAQVAVWRKTAPAA